jgi:hypothetical protein
MKDKEITLWVVKRLIKQHVRIMALEGELSLYRVDGHPPPWQGNVRKAIDSPEYKLLADGLLEEKSRAIDAAKSSDDLFRVLLGLLTANDNP